MHLFSPLLFTAVSSLLAGTALAAFGVSDSNGRFVVDTGGGLVFQVNKSTGDIVSLVYGGQECQDSAKYSHISSGLGSDNVVSSTVSSSLIRITVTAGTLTHYYIAKVTPSPSNDLPCADSSSG